MDKLEITRIALEAVAFVAIAFLSAKQFRFKESLIVIIRSAKDLKISEQEFQQIVDQIKKDIFGDSKL